MYQVELQKQVEILRWLMSAWDGQWLGRTASVYGAVEANKLNSRVRSAFGKIEMKAILSMLGKTRADNLADAAEILRTYFNVAYGERGFVGQFSSLEAIASGGIRLQVVVEKLTPLDTLKKIAAAAGESPAMVCEMLWSSWLETLLPDGHLQITIRSTAMSDLYQIDSLSEAFTGLPVPNTSQDNMNNMMIGSAGDNLGDTNRMPGSTNSNTSNLRAKLEQQTADLRARAGLTGRLASKANSLDGSGSFGAMPGGNDAGSNYTTPASFAIPTNLTPPAAPVYNTMAATPPLKPRRGGTGEFVPPPDFNKPLPGNPFGATTATESGSQPSMQIPAALNIDPTTGRPFYSNLPGGNDDSQRKNAAPDKSRAPNKVARLFMSKEARELLERSANEPQLEITSLASKIDIYLQRKLFHARIAQPGIYPENLKIVGGPEDSLIIIAGNYTYQSINDVPPGPVRDVLQQAVTEWSESDH